MPHTPGPWRVVNDVDVQSGPMRAMAYVSTAGGRGRTLEEAMANARLIAAAPDLLAACQAAIQNLDLANDDPTRVTYGVYCKLRDAIAKATSA